MWLLGGGAVALVWVQRCRGQALPVVTKTIYRSCAATTSNTFPSLGWVSSDGSSVPFTFVSPSVSSTIDASLPIYSPVDASSPTSRPIDASSPISGPVDSSLPIPSPTDTSSTISSSSDVTLSSLSSSAPPISVSVPNIPPSTDSTTAVQTGYPTISSIADVSSLAPPYSSGSPLSPTFSTESACATVSARPVSCPASNGTLYFPAGSCAGISGDESSFLLFCGRNYDGTALPPLSGVSSEETCIDECIVDSNCVAVGYDVDTLTCIKRSDVNLGSVVSAPGIIFAIQRQYYVSSQLEQPAETVPPVTMATSMEATLSSGDTSPTISPGYGSFTDQNPSATISSAPDGFPTSAGELPPGTYIFGGTALRAVIGGSTQTITSEGQLSTAVTGGLTTTYTTGGVTTTVAGPVSSPTSDAVRDAVIGACPAYDSRLYTGPESEDATYLVACGEIYNGTISGRESLLKRAVGVECISRCEGMTDCAAVSYTSGECIFYSEVNGQMDSNDPAFSAIRLDSARDVGEEIESSSSAAPVLTTTTLVSTSTSLSEVPASTMTSTIPESSFTVTLTTTALGQTTTILSVSTRDASTTAIVLPASTATILLTASIPVTITTIAPASTFVSTEREVSTLLEAPPTVTQQVTITQPASSYSFTTTVTSQIPGSTVISTNLLTTTIANGDTVTSTERVTSTLPGSTITSVRVLTTTAPGSLVVSTLISVPPPVTQQVTLTQAASTYNVTQTVTSLIPGTTVVSTSLLTTTLGTGVTITSTQQVTSTLPASTITSLQVLTTTAPGSIIVSTLVPPAVVSTQFETRTIISTRPAQVVTSFLPGSQIVSTETTTLPASTRTISYETTLRETSTILRSTSEAGVTITQTITSALPASTSTVISVSTVSGSTITNFVTRTEASVTVVSTVQAATVVLTVISTAAGPTSLSIRPTTIVSTLLQPTIVVSTSVQPTTVVSTRDITTTAQGSTVYVVSTTTSVIPASTLTQTFRTTLAAETVVVTNSAPGQTTTRAITTTRDGPTITTTSLSIRPASTATFTTSVVSYISYGRITCPQDSGLEYAGADGSRYMVLCSRDYSGTSGEGSSANIYGINPVPARDLSGCVNACTSQGTACVGITWQASSLQCILKRTMFPTDETLVVPGFDSVVRVFAGTDAPTVRGASQLTNGAFDTGALSPWVVAFQDGASVAVTNNAAVVSLTGDSGYLNLQQTLQIPVSAASGLAYFLTFSIGTSGLTQDGALAAIGFNSYALGALNYPVNQVQSKVYLSGRFDSDDITTLTFLAQSFSSDTGGMMTIDDISFTTYDQRVGVNPIPIPPVVSDATYRFVDMTVTQYAIPQLEFRQTFTLTASAEISLADSTTTCWLAINFYPFQQQIVYQSFATNGTVALSASGYLYAVTTSYDLEFNCQGVGGSVLTMSSFFLKAF